MDKECLGDVLYMLRVFPSLFVLGGLFGVLLLNVSRSTVYEEALQETWDVAEGP